VYNFKEEKLPPHAFSFRCKKCHHKVTVSQAQLEAATAEAKDKKDTAGKKVKLSLFRIQPEKLKNTLLKAGGVLSALTGHSERFWIFTLTKFFVYCSIGLLVVLLILGGITYFSIGSNRPVSYTEVERSLELKQDPLITIQAAVPEVKIPSLVKKYLGDGNRGTFVDWMNGLAENQKRDFIENLELIIGQAQKKDPEHIYDYINEYKSLKFKRSVDKPAANYLLKFGVIVAMITMVALLGLFSLILSRLPSQRTLSEPAEPSPGVKDR